MSEFGPIIDYGRVENAIRDLVILPWIDTYLVAVERENDIRVRSITRPRHWEILDDLTVAPEKNMPVLYVISGGEETDPQDDGEGRLWATLSMAVWVAQKDTNRDTTRLTARRYGAATATLVQHKLGLAGLGVRLVSRPRQTFDEALSAPSGQRAFIFGVTTVTFTVQVDTIGYSRGGPDEPFPPPVTPRDPDAPPNPADPDHLSTQIAITAAGIGEPLTTPELAADSDPTGANASVLFSMAAATIGPSGAFTVRARTLIRELSLTAGTPPTGQPLTIQVLVGDVVIDTLTIPPGNTAPTKALSSYPVEDGDQISVNATSVGSPPAGNVVVQVDLNKP